MKVRVRVICTEHHIELIHDFATMIWRLNTTPSNRIRIHVGPIFPICNQNPSSIFHVYSATFVRSMPRHVIPMFKKHVFRCISSACLLRSDAYAFLLLEYKISLQAQLNVEHTTASRFRSIGFILILLCHNDDAEYR